ncbi:MAG: TIGR01777 family protein [Myxococcaceae bacterium]|jgi:uncharacterized protein (TIGR01777 family)|nr:TIGR01777 family protein [Myxococcaceae bacterium]MCA3013696.1 TIGR01777 family protein [Myxococcaceae bacterium]
MQTFVQRTEMPVTREALSAWHERPGAFERLNPPFDPVEIESRTGGLEVGARTVIRANVGPVAQRWVAEHTAYEPGVLFRDELRSGPFKSWVHTHRFLDGARPGSSVLEDEIRYELPLGPLGALVGGGFARGKLERAFAYRHALTKADLERHARFASAPRRTIAVTGASGLLASSLVPFLTTGGHTVRAVKRRGSELDASTLEGADAVVHLAGAGVADERWTPERKRLLVDSRVAYTRQLVEAMKRLKAPPRVLISSSAVGVYGDRGDEVLDERSVPGARSDEGPGFLAGLCLDWEAEARAAEALGVRVVLMRIGVVMTARGGALAKLLPPFRAGAGGPTGSGAQWMSWISSEDLVGAFHHALMTDSLAGVVNATAPEPVTAKAFAKALGRVLSRPAITPVPAVALKALFGELAEATILAGSRVRPAALETSGFSFLHPTLEPALRATLGL